MSDPRQDRLVRQKGTKGASIFLKTLARDKQFKNAMETPLGVELLDDVTENLINKVELVLNEKDDGSTRAEIKAYREILSSWAAKINSADKHQLEFNQLIEEK